MEPVDRSTIWPYDEHGEPREFFYARYGHPAGVAAEKRLGELEDGEALLYASGLAAETAVVLTFARPGMTVAVARDAYYGTSVLLGTLGPWGLHFVEYDQAGPPPAEAEIVWVESPANPTLTLPNWDELRAHPGLVVCDATVSTPMYLHALDEGADIVVHSGTKFLTGHHNGLVGATVTRDPSRTAALRETRTHTGGVCSPDSAAALLAGLESLPDRMTRITASASELARRLAEHERVTQVRYPGYSGLVSFDVENPRHVETRTRLIVNSTSLGGAQSTMESRYRWEGDRIPAGLLRLSVGLENVDELWEDLVRALA